MEPRSTRAGCSAERSQAMACPARRAEPNGELLCFCVCVRRGAVERRSGYRRLLAGMVPGLDFKR